MSKGWPGVDCQLSDLAYLSGSGFHEGRLSGTKVLAHLTPLRLPLGRLHSLIKRALVELRWGQSYQARPVQHHPRHQKTSPSPSALHRLPHGDENLYLQLSPPCLLLVAPPPAFEISVGVWSR